MSASGSLVELRELMARGMQEMTTEEQPKRGHVLKAQAFLDGSGGAYTQVYKCDCGQVYVVTRAGRKQPIRSTVIAQDCPLTVEGGVQ